MVLPIKYFKFKAKKAKNKTKKLNSLIVIYRPVLVDLPVGAVAVVQRRELWVVEAISRLLGKDLVPALIKIPVDGT